MHQPIICFERPSRIGETTMGNLLSDQFNIIPEVNLLFERPENEPKLMYTRSLFQTEDMIEQHHILNKMAELIDNGVIKTTVGEHFGQINAENLRKAHALLESGKAKGKIVLEGF